MQLVWFFACTGLVAVVTYFLTRKDDHASNTGYFLAGRKLTAPFIAGSLLLTNLSTEQMVGLNGAAFADGLCVMVWEVVAVVALVAMAMFFLPRFLKSGIATLPQYLRERYDSGTETITNVIFLLAYAAILLPIILYTGATGLAGMMDVKGLLGITGESVSVLGLLTVPSDTFVLWLMVWLVGLIGACYAIIGGLRTVAVSDTLNGVGLLVGGLMITVFGLTVISQRFGDGGGMLEGLDIIRQSHPQKLNSIGGPETSVPFSTVFTGILLLNLFYWCTNQQIIQRTFGANSLREGQKGVLLTGLLKLIGPLYLVLPGIMAFQLYAGEGIKADMAYGRLVNDVLPTSLVGFFAAVLVGAILSSFNSALNSTTTLFSLGVYKPFLRKDAAEREVVRSGKIFGWIMAVIAMTIAPLLASTGSIFAYLQKMNGLYFIPIFSVVVVGMLTRRTPPKAAKIALVAGLLIIAFGYFVPIGTQEVAVAGDPSSAIESRPMYISPDIVQEFHFLGIVFAALVATMLIVGRLAPLAEPWQQRDSKQVDLTPWRYAPHAAVALIVLVLAIYVAFADFSVLG